MKKRRSVRFRVLAVLLSIAVFVVAFLSLAQLGVLINAKRVRWAPDYEKTDISALLFKNERTEEDYRTLYEQTGLTRLGIDGLLKSGNFGRILNIQTAFFKQKEILSKNIAPFTFYERFDEVMPTAELENGDIILTASVYVSFFRYGHSALVTDASQGELLESFSPGTTSSISSKDVLLSYCTFLIVRPKATKEVRTQVAAYAAKELVGIPYKLTAGIFEKKYDERGLKTTQCTHIVWYAYQKFGIDLDGNGGKIVKPQDVFLSEQVELVQAYGFDLDRLWRE
ncbi:MAG: hypothetical protein IJX81_06625 [Clostridia bacterium]|nr:hypothetical protein [Clostridia bacterium]